MLNSTPQLTSFAAVVQQSGLRPLLGTAPLTIFAPTNDAISHIRSVTQMLEGQGNNQSPDFQKLQLLVRAHLVSGSHPEDQMHGKVELTTQAGTTIAIDGTTQRGIMLTAHESRVNLSGFRTIPGRARHRCRDRMRQRLGLPDRQRPGSVGP